MRTLHRVGADVGVGAHAGATWAHPTIEIIGITLVGSAIAIAGPAAADDRFVPGRAK
jgi:hypothetical protein